MSESRWIRLWIPLLLSAFLYILLAYFTERSDSIQLLSLFVVLTALFLWINRLKEPSDLRWVLISAITVRLVLLISIPNLSDDVFRFIWDGRVLMNGLNPFAHLPSELLNQQPGLDESLYTLLNSQDKFTIYPPISQFVFWLAATASPGSVLGSVVAIRLVILMGEIGALLLIRKLLQQYGYPPGNIYWWAFNPFIILELTGNLHFEGLMFFFVLLAIALLTRRRVLSAGIAIGMAIGVKLLPLIFMPLFIRRLTIQKFLLFSIAAGVSVLILFSPLFSQDFLSAMSSSLGLYFTKFEFNASLYYLIREWDFQSLGYNNIAVIGPRMALATLILIVLYTIYESRNKKLVFKAMLWVGLIYFLFSTTVHPWYLATLVGLGLFSDKRWPMVWAFLAFLTYMGYSESGYQENFFLITAEYLVVAGWILYEERESFRKWRWV